MHASPPARRRVAILGSTGSVGRQTLDAVVHLNALHERGAWPTRYDIVALAAGRNAETLREQVVAHRPGVAALAEGAFDTPGGCRVLTPTDAEPDAAAALIDAAELEPGRDMVVAAMVGFAGLGATLRAVELGVDVALANKETLVAAGSVVTAAAERSGARLLPVDSEHAGVWQCLMAAEEPAPPTRRCTEDIARVTLTASGGAFRDWPLERITSASPADALKHPTWSMGDKVTIDSASLTNKAFELIEAHWLFGLGAERLDAVIHRQSVVHAMIERRDGSVIAQLGATDMRGPILAALAWPGVAPALTERLDLARLGRLDFEPVDPDRFPAVELGFEVIQREGGAGAAFNAANEVAVEAFLAGKLRFPDLFGCARRAVDALGDHPVTTAADARAIDTQARAMTRAAIA